MSPDPSFDLISDPDVAPPPPAVVQLALVATPRQIEPVGSTMRTYYQNRQTAMLDERPRITRLATKGP
ncbi:MAG: hypothetical protein WAU95_12695 [Anaerolineae bacterium]